MRTMSKNKVAKRDLAEEVDLLDSMLSSLVENSRRKRCAYSRRMGKTYKRTSHHKIGSGMRVDTGSSSNFHP
jgi:hypothetical protein